MLLICADPAILDIDVTTLPKVRYFGVESLEVSLRHGLVDRAPFNGVVGDLVSNQKLVFGRTAGKLPGPDDEGPVGGQVPLSPFDGVL